MARLVAFPYYGGKYYQLNWLLPLLPKCHHFVEPFCGAAYVALNREPSKLETINDIDGGVINFFKVLRDNGEELIDKLRLTPYSRNEFVHAINYNGDDKVEQARCFFVKQRQAFSGIPNPSEGHWKFTKYKSGGNNPPINNINCVQRLNVIISRLLKIQIDNRPATDVIIRNDTPDTLFYCDPPYVGSSRAKAADQVYKNEMSDDDHRELANVLHNVKGRVAISGHRSDLYEELYGDWQRHDKDCFLAASNKAKIESKRRVDSVWCNYG